MKADGVSDKLDRVSGKLDADKRDAMNSETKRWNKQQKKRQE
jgi:hypothetical protein